MKPRSFIFNTRFLDLEGLVREILLCLLLKQRLLCGLMASDKIAYQSLANIIVAFERSGRELVPVLVFI